MSFKKRNIEILRSNIGDDGDNRTNFIISWDSIKHQYVLELREYYGDIIFSHVSETINLNNQKLNIFNQRLPEVVELLNKFNSHHTIPVNNYIEVNRLCDKFLTANDRLNWNVLVFNLDNQ